MITEKYNIKPQYKFLAAFLIVFFCLANLLAQQDEIKTELSPDSFVSITTSIETYKGKSIAMILKLKHIDRIFGSITFYDSNNHDITFEISEPKKWKHFTPALLNAHEGMNYNVVFIVTGTGNLGLLTGELVSFEPWILERLP